MNKKERGLIIFEDFFEIASVLTNDSEFRRVIEAMRAYNRDGTVPNFVGAMKAVFLCGKMAIDRNSEKWDKKLEQRSNAGKKGGGPRNRKGSGGKSDEEQRTSTNDKKSNEEQRTPTNDKKNNEEQRTPTNDKKSNEEQRTSTNDKKSNEEQRKATNATIPTSISISTSNSMSNTLLSESVDVTPSYVSLVGPEVKKPKRSKQTRKKTMGTLRSLYPEACGFWDRIRNFYPSPRRHEPSEGTLQIIEAEKLWEKEDAIIKSIIAWSNCDEWKRGYALRMSRFIEEGYYKNEPPAPKGPEVIQRIISTHAPRDECTEDTDIPTL